MSVSNSQEILSVFTVRHEIGYTWSACRVHGECVRRMSLPRINERLNAVCFQPGKNVSEPNCGKDDPVFLGSGWSLPFSLSTLHSLPCVVSLEYTRLYHDLGTVGTLGSPLYALCGVDSRTKFRLAVFTINASRPPSSFTLSSADLKPTPNPNNHGTDGPDRPINPHRKRKGAIEQPNQWVHRRRRQQRNETKWNQNQRKPNPTPNEASETPTNERTNEGMNEATNNNGDRQ